MAKRRVGVLPNNIILLQNVVKRDPESYHEEFLQQYAHYESLRDIFLHNPTAADKNNEFGELIGFVGAVTACYPKETANFPNELREILLNNHRDLSPDLREKIIQCLTMLRNKDIISLEMLIQTLFPLLTAYLSGAYALGVHVKALRKQIYLTLVAMLKQVNAGHKNQKINRLTQALLFSLLEQRDTQGLWATKLTRELWRRGIWDDSRTVELMTQAAIHPDVKVALLGIKFFLGADKERDEANDSDLLDDEAFDLTGLRHKMNINKKLGKRGKKLEAAVKAVKKKLSAKHLATYLNFSAIHLLRDPQGFAEALFSTHLLAKNNKFDLDQKIATMNLVSRLIGTHKLTVLGIYTFFLKYLTPKQRQVTQVMAAAAQASHDLVPPEAITVVIRKIADEFVSEGVSAEVALAGLNTIREILSRAPLAIDLTLLQDLVEYKGSKAKPVMMAARSLVTLYREVAPEMLARKDRGKTAAMELASGEHKGLPQFGADTLTHGIPGLELLAKWKVAQGMTGEESEGELAWEVDSEDEDDVEGDWVTVELDKEYDISDLEDESSKKRAREESDDESDSDLELSDEEEANDEAGEASDEKKPKTREPRPKLTKEERKQLREEKKEARKNKRAKLVESETKSLDPETAAKEAKMLEILKTKVLTPADFAKIEELRTQAGVEKAMGLKNEDEVDLTLLVGRAKYKQLREERIAHAKEGREDREFGLRKGKRDAPHSTTNKEKARKKNFIMTIHKRAVSGKQKMSLRDRQKVLRAHVDRMKRGGRSGNF